MELTFNERLFLINQLKILEFLDVESASHYEKFREALENGYTLQYDWFTDHISKEELSEEKCREVFNILDMYSSLIISFKNLKDKENIEEHDVTFLGFGGNDEGELLGYVRYVLDDLGRFTYIKEFNKGDFNSHMPMLNIYQKRLAKWKKLNKYDKLTADEIKSVISKD